MKKTNFFLSLALMLIFLSACNDPVNLENKITTFQECVQQGGNIAESYPRQCILNGETYVEEISENYQTLCENLDGTWLEESQECENISQEECENIVGTFDGCASACRNDPNAMMCIQVCVPVCSFKTE